MRFEVGFTQERTSVGVVEEVSADNIQVLLFDEAPHGTALREGALYRFPRLNSYLILPSEAGSLLAIVIWLGIKDEPGTPRGPSDRIGLPKPQRRLSALPLGVLRRKKEFDQLREPDWELDRGVLVFPTVGDPVRLPTRWEAASVIPGVEERGIAVRLGKAPLSADGTVEVDANRLFGRHLAVLGNTGSGKSCSLVRLLRSSALALDGRPSGFRTILLDMNGEYQTAFNGLDPSIEVRHFSAFPTNPASEQFRLPAWLWSYREWLSFAEASMKSQAPQLRRALHLLKTSDVGTAPTAIVPLVAGRRVVRQYKAGAIDPKNNQNCLSVLDNAMVACDAIYREAEDSVGRAVEGLRDKLTNVLSSRRGTGGYPWALGARLLDYEECQELLDAFDAAIEAVGVPEVLDDTSAVDKPIPFDPGNIVELLPLLAVDSGPEAVGWVMPLVERVRIALSDERLNALAGWQPGESLGGILESLLGSEQSNRVCIIDMSLVPSNVVHIVAAVLGRLVLEALERHRREYPDEQTPVVLVAEEAHTLMRRDVKDTGDDGPVSMERQCREAFERIAREGRKFGLSLVVSSQRPSELSETVLSQCNTFLIHRIVNDLDQRLVRKLMPDALGGLTDELPALPGQTALLAGWAAEVPTLIRIDDVAPEYQPLSTDPDFSGTWSRERQGGADWESVRASWTGS